MPTSTSDKQSVTSSQGADVKTNKRRWRDMGWSSTAGSGLANLMRSARQSTDSLRSVASSTARSTRSGVNKPQQQANEQPSHASSRDNPARSLHNNKDLPPSPYQNVESRTSISSARSDVMYNVPEDAPLEFYEMPPEKDEDGGDSTIQGGPVVKGPYANAMPGAPPSKTNGTATGNALFAGTALASMSSTVDSTNNEGESSDRERDNATPTKERPEATNSKRDTIVAGRDASALHRQVSIVAGDDFPASLAATRGQAEMDAVSGGEGGGNNSAAYDGWTAEQAEREAGSKTPTNDDSRSSYQNEAKQRIGSSARSLARKSLTKMRRKSSAAGEDASPGGVGNSEPPLPTTQSARSAPLSAGTQWASDKVGGGDGNTIAQLYAVFGLPKDPSVWTLAEEDCVTGVHHIDGAINRFWRPEVLGCSICPSPSDVLGLSKGTSAGAEAEGNGASKWEGRSGTAEKDGKKAQSPKFIEMSDGRGGTEKAETARVLSKALKLSFTREVEIVAEQGHYPPKATSHTFSFSVPTVAASGQAGVERSGDGRKAAMATGVSVGMAQAANGVGEGYGLATQRNRNVGGLQSNNDDGPRLATFYGVALTVWSAADDKRAKVIRKELSRAAKQRSMASTGVASQKNSTMPKSSTAPSGESSAGGSGAAWDDQPPAMNDEGTNAMLAAAQSPDTVFFMPYAICIVSRFPLYNLLGDWNKMAWHKYSRNIEMHNSLMSTILRHPAPRLGEEISVGSPEKDVSFHCIFPGAVEWGSGLLGIDFAMWPLFNTLSVDNVLTICEIALGYNGRVLFISRHPALLGMAVETVRYLIEQCGWRGVAHQNCHARDVRIYLEDPGSWMIGINTELRGLAIAPKEVCVVDLDVNRVQCALPPPGALSTKTQRERRARRIMQAVFVSHAECAPPRDYVDAYPGARFRPLSRMVTRDLNTAYEQLPTPRWWNQTATIQAFDQALRDGNKPSLLRKVFQPRSRRSQNTLVASSAEVAAITALRKRASTFVDARDGLENKIGRLNKRLAFLMSESEMWRAQFAKIQVLVDRLTKEANDLRAKVDKERRESRRLSSRLAQQDMEHVQMQLQLKETESAREEAYQELLRMKTALDSVEQEREAMMEEIRDVLAGRGNIEDVNLSVSRLDLPSFGGVNPLLRSDSPTGSQVSMTPSQAAEYVLKARAMAEARISEGRPGRTTSRRGSQIDSAHGHGLVRSLSQDRGERSRNASFSAAGTASQSNHFPDEQMNYEIQQRTSIVTDQISRIQQQLESTLTNLEGRRSGTYERENERRRQRRSSNASIGSRYEYRGSSIGHGGAESVGGYASEDGRSEALDYEQVESVGSHANTRAGYGSRRRKERLLSVGTGGGAGQGVSNAPPTASSNSLREAYAATTGSNSNTLHGSARQSPLLPTKSLSRSRNNTVNEAAIAAGGWNMPTSPTDATLKAQPLSPLFDVQRNKPPRSPNMEVVTNNTPTNNTPTTTAPPPPTDSTDVVNGVASQPFLSALKPRSEGGSELASGDPSDGAKSPVTSQIISSLNTSASANGNHSQATAHSSSYEPANVSGGTSPTLAVHPINGRSVGEGTKSEVLLSQTGWTMDPAVAAADNKVNGSADGTDNGTEFDDDVKDTSVPSITDSETPTRMATTTTS